MRLVFLGPPGAGKGTQATRLATGHGVPHISTGDILRRSIAMATPSGVEAKEYVDNGALVPFDLILRLVRDRLQEGDTESGWILDGFPRNLEQERAVDDLLRELEQTLSRVVYIHVADEELVKRLSGRRVCKDCGETFHALFSPPRRDGVCDQCDGELYQRSDDVEDAIRNRLVVYRAETQPLVDLYQSRDLLLKIEGGAAMDQVAEDVERGLKR